jgi:3-phosphoglycerate kinase
MRIKTIRDTKFLKGKTALLRVDFNVPVKNGVVEDDFKIIAALPTLRFLKRYCRKVVIMTHLGSDEAGKKIISIRPLAKYLERIMAEKVTVIKAYAENRIPKQLAEKDKGLFFLENLRWNEGERTNNREFAKYLSKLGDVYINDAFAVSHRKHASVSAIKEFMPSYAGLLLAKEIENLNKLIKPRKPFVVILGGAKIRTKLPLIKNFLKISDVILVGGVLANDFLSAKGYDIGKSHSEPDDIRIAKRLYAKKIILPVDVTVERPGKNNIKSYAVDDVPKDAIIYDIGPKTISSYSDHIKKASTIVWNGPMGLFERTEFNYGTLAIARVVASYSRRKAFGVVGGGETIEALRMSKMSEYVDWMSTGGGAMLAYLGREPMPGLKGLIKIF